MVKIFVWLTVLGLVVDETLKIRFSKLEFSNSVTMKPISGRYNAKIVY